MAPLLDGRYQLAELYEGVAVLVGVGADAPVVDGGEGGDTGAEIVCAADNSCLMHIDGALSRQRTGVRCMHLAEILAEDHR